MLEENTGLLFTFAPLSSGNQIDSRWRVSLTLHHSSPSLHLSKIFLISNYYHQKDKMMLRGRITYASRKDKMVLLWRIKYLLHDLISGEEWWRVVKRQSISSPYILLNTNHLNIKGEEWRVFPKKVSIPCIFFFSWLFLLHFLLILLFYTKIYCTFACVFKTYYNLSISDIDVSNNM